MYVLNEYVGKEKVIKALRRLLEQHKPDKQPLTTSLDLYRELQTITPDSLQYLLHDLFAANTFWDLKTDRATVKRTAGNAWEVTLDVEAHKVVIDSLGVEKEIKMNDWVEVGVFVSTDQDVERKQLYLQKHLIQSGKQRITMTVASKPTSAGIDPNYFLIDLKTNDNIKKVKIE